MNVYVTDQNIHLQAQPGENLLQVLRRGGVDVEAPCGGGGKCGKCKVWVDGEEQLACHYAVEKDITVHLPEKKTAEVLTRGLELRVQADGTDRYVLAFDLGTTTVVAYLMDGSNGQILARASCVNPQSRFGADVISRIQYAMDGEGEALSRCIRDSLAELTHLAAGQAGVDPGQITAAALVGNTAMHHLLLGIDPKPLTTPPYMPSVSEAMTVAADFLPVAPGTELRILPNIAGFVGADTVGCLVATEFDQLEDVTLMIDIGTNGEMVLKHNDTLLCCATAAGPCFEGAGISCGVPAIPGAICRVWAENGALQFDTVAHEPPVGLCGTGLVDAIAVLLKLGLIDETGYLEESFRFGDSDVLLTPKDIRQFQLAKSAIRSGLDTLLHVAEISPSAIDAFYIAGGFGSALNIDSAVQTGLIPAELAGAAVSIGNGAGAGAAMVLQSRPCMETAVQIAARAKAVTLTENAFFTQRYAENMLFSVEY